MGSGPRLQPVRALQVKVVPHHSSVRADNPSVVAFRITLKGIPCVAVNIRVKIMFSLYYEQQDGTRRFLQAAVNEADALATAMNLSRSALVVILVIEEEADRKDVRYRLQKGMLVEAASTESGSEPG
jgi:hypothetical protein